MTGIKSKSFKIICLIVAMITFVASIPIISAGETSASHIQTCSSTGDISTDSGRTAYTVDGKDYALYSDKIPKPDEATVNYFYSDGYFMEDPAKINSHLAAMSMITAFASAPDSVALQALLIDLGFSNFFVSEYYRSDYVGTENDAKYAPCLIASKELKYLDGSSTGKTLIAIIPRTGTELNEWGLDLTIGTEGESAGILPYTNGIFAHAQSYINTYFSDEANDGSLVFWTTGQSRGGTIANLIGKRLIDNYTKKTASGYKNPVYAYCNASFYGGVQSALKTENLEIYKACIHNFENDADIVCKLVPYVNEEENTTSTGFTRYGTTTKIITNESDVTEIMKKIKPSLEPRGPFQLMYLNVNITSVASIAEIISLIKEIRDGKDVIVPVSDKYEDAANVTMNNFQRSLQQHTAKWQMTSREAYASTTRMETNYTYQDAIKAYLDLFCLLPRSDLNKLLAVIKGDDEGTGALDVLLNMLEYKNVGGKIYTKTELLIICNTILNWDNKEYDWQGYSWVNNKFVLVGEEYWKAQVIDLVKAVLANCKSADGKTTVESILGSEKYATLNEYLPVIIDILLGFSWNDYFKNYEQDGPLALSTYSGECRAMLLASIINNLTKENYSIAYQHFPVVYVGTLILNDDFYDNSSILTIGREVFYAGSLPDGTTSAQLYVDGAVKNTFSIDQLKYLDIKSDIEGANEWELRFLGAEGKALNSCGTAPSGDAASVSYVVFNESGAIDADKLKSVQIANNGGILCNLMDADIPEYCSWVKVVKDAEGKALEYQAKLPSTVVSAMIGVYDEAGRLIKTVISDVSNTNGYMTIDMTAVGVPTGGTWKIFSTDASYAPKLAATSGE